MTNLFINGKCVEVQKDSTILEAAKRININIPTLCYMEMSDGDSVNCKGTCRICVVEVEGDKKLQPSCSVVVKEGMRVFTNTRKVRQARKTILELILSNHPMDCLNCKRNLSCELQSLARDFGIDGIDYHGNGSKIDKSTPIIRNMEKCILCRRCVTSCNDVQNINVLTPVNRSFNTEIQTFNDKPLCDTGCTYCGQCVAVCPTGALTEREDYLKLETLLENKDKMVVVQMAPAVRVALCDEFGVSSEILTTKKIVAALKAMNFYKVFDTNFSADLTIMEETQELIGRIAQNKNLPMFTSCCPAWVRMVETKYGDYINLLSSCKSPQQMFGAIAKSYLPDKLSIKKENMVVASIMPCIAKKYEAERDEMEGEVDIVITTREFAKLIRENGIDICNIEEEDFDSPLGVSSGAAMLFGATGGVMEAALRTAYEKITGEVLNSIVFTEVRGLKGIKKCNITIKGTEFRIAVVSSLKNARKIMDDIICGKVDYDFIEVMACPGGCINGGGQPYIKSRRVKLEKRMDFIYSIDEKNTLRKSDDNPEIKQIYKEFLGEPNSSKAHELLHTKYIKR